MKGVLEGCWEAHQTGEAYDADGPMQMRGRKAITRIAEYIIKIVPVLDKTIKAKGGVVPDELYRTGRRWRRVDDKGTRVTAHGSPACGSARPRWSPSLITRSSRRPARPLWTRLQLARASRGGGDSGVRHHGPAHRGANGAAMPTDEDDQDGQFFYNHPERGDYPAA